MGGTRSPERRPDRLWPRALCVVLLALALGAGCERLRSITTSDPERLLEEARIALANGSPNSSESMVGACEAAWPSLKRIGSEHRESAESNEAFRLASWCLRKVYDFRRYHVPDSPFVTSEPRFMLEWLVHFFDDEFPQEQVDQLLLGMPYSLFRDFQAIAEGHPQLSRWTLHAKRENGRIEYVRATPAETDPPSTAVGADAQTPVPSS
jgi:hypothetical protein